MKQKSDLKPALIPPISAICYMVYAICYWLNATAQVSGQQAAAQCRWSFATKIEEHQVHVTFRENVDGHFSG
jgi:hypothetical protein